MTQVRQVHGSAHGRDRILLARVPVGQVAGGTDLEGPEHADVQVTAAHHGEAVGVVKVGTAGQQRDRLFARVDEVVVFLPCGRRRAHAQQTVLAVQQHFALFRDVVGH